jgi:hypothetical protein
MTAACTFDLRNVQLIDADGAAGQGGTRARDASEEASDARAGTNGAAGMGGRSDASLDGHAGAGGSGGATGKGGAAGASGSSGRAGTGGSGGAADASSGGASGLAGIGGAAGIAGIGGMGGVAGAWVGGAAGLAGGSGSGAGGAGGAAGRDGGTTAGTAGQGGNATGGSDSGTFDAREGGTGGGSLDAADGGGLIVLFEENFDSALGTFTVENGCGPTPPVWSNDAGYAHAADLATLGVSSIYGPSITVPAGVSDVRLRMSHKLNTDPGYDGGQLELSVNGAAPRLVTTFIVGPYTTEGVHPHPLTCAEAMYPGAWPGWSGNHAEFESAMNLSASPFNVVAGDTVSIRFRMLVDSRDAGIGWDINWVRLTGTPP